LVGKEADGLSPNTVVRLKEKWTEEHEAWNQRRLDDKRYVYIWGDGIHVNVRLGEALLHRAARAQVCPAVLADQVTQ